MSFASAVDGSRGKLIGEIENADIAATILRVTMGLMFLAHVWLKVVIFTPAGTAGYFVSLGLPAALAYIVIVAESLGAIALILGVGTRWVALALLPILLGSIYTPHGANGFFSANTGGGWEFPAFWAVALIVQALLGNGVFALRRSQS